MIDKDEYPQTAELERRCVQHAGRPVERRRTRRRGRLFHDRVQRGLHARRDGAQAALGTATGAGAAGGRPNLVMGINVQVVLGEVLQLLGGRAAPGADGGGPLPPRAPKRRSARCDENTIGVVGDPRLHVRRQLRAGREIAAALDELQERKGLDVPVHVDGASGGDGRAVPRPRSGVGLPAAPGRLDQHLGPQVRAGLPGRRLGRLARRRGAAGGTGLQRQLSGRLDAHLRAELLPSRRPGGRAVLQLLPAGPGGLSQGAAELPRRGHLPVGGMEKSGPFRLITVATSCRCSPSPRRGRAAATTSSTSPGGCASAAGWCRPTRSRQNRTGSGGAAHRGAQRFLAGPGRPADGGHTSGPATSAAAARASSRLRRRRCVRALAPRTTEHRRQSGK